MLPDMTQVGMTYLVDCEVPSFIVIVIFIIIIINLFSPISYQVSVFW